MQVPHFASVIQTQRVRMIQVFDTSPYQIRPILKQRKTNIMCVLPYIDLGSPVSFGKLGDEFSPSRTSFRNYFGFNPVDVHFCHLQARTPLQHVRAALICPATTGSLCCRHFMCTTSVYFNCFYVLIMFK